MDFETPHNKNPGRINLNKKYSQRVTQRENKTVFPLA